MKKNNELIHRIKLVMEALKMDKTTFDKHLGTKNNLGKYLSGARSAEPLSDKLTKIGVSADWFLTGKGVMFLKDVKGRDEKSKHYEEIGKAIHETLKKLLKQEKEEEHLGLVAGEPKTCGVAIENIPLYAHTIAAGPPTDSSCPVEEHLDLPKHMITHPAHTYAVRVSGDSMKGSGIKERDILIVDTAIEPQHKNIVIASVNGEQTVKQLWIEGKKIKLMPKNSHHEPINVQKGMDFRTQGVVTWVIRQTA